MLIRKEKERVIATKKRRRRERDREGMMITCKNKSCDMIYKVIERETRLGGIHDAHTKKEKKKAKLILKLYNII